MEKNKEEFKKEFKKRIYRFTLSIIDFLDKLPKDNVSKRIGDQLLRSSTSIIGNYIEGQSASSRKDFANYMNTSLKSANESKLWLCILLDTKRSNPEKSGFLLDELKEISNIFASIMLTLRNKR